MDNRVLGDSGLLSSHLGGLRDRDAQEPSRLSASQLARIASSVAAKWLEEELLVGQEVLVDLPHLVLRQPLGTLDLSEDVSPTDLAHVFSASAAALVTGRCDGAYSDAQLLPLFWTARPAWRWRALQSDHRIPDVADPWGSPVLDVVVGEDVSAYLRRGEATEVECGPFTSYRQRYIARLPGILYVGEVLD